MASAGYWTRTRPNGKPVDEGTVCWVTEIEGLNPIYTYGKSEQDVIDKLSLNQAHTQSALARQTTQTPPSDPPAPATSRQKMTPEEVMVATADLQNPAKAGHAAARLIQDATGIDLQQMALENFSKIAMDWQGEHPDFYAHPGNKRLLTEQARAMAGGDLTLINKDVLTRAFQTLRQRGELYDAPPDLSSDPNNPNSPPAFPGESPVQRTTERPRGSFSTGARSTSFRAPQTSVPKTLKYTAEDIRTMPESKSRRLIETNDPDYAEACERFFGVSASA